MVASLRLSSEPVTQKSGAILKKPVPRPDWMLSNDDVELQLKIGSVCIYLHVASVDNIFLVRFFSI